MPGVKKKSHPMDNLNEESAPLFRIPRNILDDSLVTKACETLAERVTNEHVKRWIHSTFAAYLRAHLPAWELVTPAKYNEYKLIAFFNAASAGVYQRNLRRLHQAVLPITDNVPEWVIPKLTAGFTVQVLKPIPEQTVFLQELAEAQAKAIRAGEDYKFLPIQIAGDHVSAHYMCMNQFSHWIDYLVNQNYTRQIRSTVPELIGNVIAWDKQIFNQKLIEELENDTTRIWAPSLHGTPYYLVRLDTKNAYKREGKLMSHCVGSYWREGQANDPRVMADAKAWIFSLRAEGEVRPVATIEVRFVSAARDPEVKKFMPAGVRRKNQASLVPAEGMTGAVLPDGLYYSPQIRGFGNSAVPDEAKLPLAEALADIGFVKRGSLPPKIMRLLNKLDAGADDEDEDEDDDDDDEEEGEADDSGDWGF